MSAMHAQVFRRVVPVLMLLSLSACGHLWFGENRQFVISKGEDPPLGYRYTGQSVFVGEDRWTEKTSLPIPVECPRAAGVGGKVYVFAGQYGTSVTARAVQRFDPGAGNEAAAWWTMNSIMPAPVSFPAVATMNGRIYVAGGVFQRSREQPLRGAWEYRPDEDRWYEIASLGSASWDGAMTTVTVEGPPLIGGTGQPPVVQRPARLRAQRLHYLRGFGNVGAPYGLEHESYYPSLDRWMVDAPQVPEARYGFTAAAVGDQTFVIGGRVVDDESDDEYPAETLRYRHGANLDARWSVAAPLPTPREYAASAVLAGKVFVVGGFDQHCVSATPPHQPYVCALDTVEMYDPMNDRWTEKAPLPIAAGDVALATAGGRIYAIGGRDHYRRLLTDYGVYCQGASFRVFEYHPGWLFHVHERTGKGGL